MCFTHTYLELHKSVLSTKGAALIILLKHIACHNLEPMLCETAQHTQHISAYAQAQCHLVSVHLCSVLMQNTIIDRWEQNSNKDNARRTTIVFTLVREKRCE